LSLTKDARWPFRPKDELQPDKGDDEKEKKEEEKKKEKEEEIRKAQQSSAPEEQINKMMQQYITISSIITVMSKEKGWVVLNGCQYLTIYILNLNLY
jgi:cytochrome b involved in lipid metabolism